ncbi:MAG: agmatine deiminase family protein [Candidatus Eremiobacteraeota bacterium]|nr:agmatine deiminase family protein [Candidatus Eremiobacteraeota bacterium]MCW5871506.1 agmatine deiminase family protein [Candidatus Eremiobacteraeota bacterium]
MDIQQTRLLSHTAKLTGARFRAVISERDRIVMPRNAAAFAEGIEEHRAVELQMPRSREWTRVTSGEQLLRLVETAWDTGYQAAQALLPPVAGAAMLLSDAGGQIRNLLLQCPDLHFAQTIAPVWSQLAEHTSPETQLTVAVPAGATGDSARDYLNEHVARPEKLQFLTVEGGEHWLSQWSRDSVLPLRTAQGEEMLGVPNRLHWASANRNPEGETMDTVVPYLLAQQGRTQKVSPLPWISLDGGNVVNNGSTAFVGEDSLHNTGKLLEETGCEQPAQEVLCHVLGKPVVVLPQMTFHIDLACTPLGEKTMLVADPALGQKLLQAVPVAEQAALEREMARAANLPEESLLAGYLAQPIDPQSFNQAAEQLRQEGYQVVRVPFLGAPAYDQPVLSYNNVLVEEYGDRKQVFLPQYGCGPLDRAARRCYEELGYTVVPVDMAEISRKQGALRCSALPISRDLT